MHIGHALRQYKCSKCRLTFTHLGNLAYHEKEKHNVIKTKASFKCNECNHPFILEEALNYHQKTEHGYEIESFDCDKCDWKFFSKAASYVHKKLHHDSEYAEGELFCSFCSEVCFSEKEIVKHHLDNHKLFTRLPLYLCDNCEFSSSRISETKEHLKTKHDIDEYKPFICNICDLKWDDPCSFFKHNQNHHIGYENRQKFVCDLCGRAMLSSTNLRRHKIVHSAGKEKNFVCDICGLATTTDWYLDKHKRQQHKRGKDIKCEYCEKLFRRTDCLQRHIDSKHPDTSAKNFTCTKCEQSFIFKNSLCHHLYNHHKTPRDGKIEEKTDTESDVETVKKKKDIKCLYCEQLFRRKDQRERHIDNIHPDTSEKFFPCTNCEKSFIFKSSLNNHAYKHHKIPTNGKIEEQTDHESGFGLVKNKNNIKCDIKGENRQKFICEECGKELISKASLKRHIQFKHSDTSEKNFVCTQCGKHFMLNNSLQRHSKFNCNKGEKKKRMKKNHRTFTSDLKKYFCDSCKKEYSLKVS